MYSGEDRNHGVAPKVDGRTCSVEIALSVHLRRCWIKNLGGTPTVTLNHRWREQTQKSGALSLLHCSHCLPCAGASSAADTS